MGIRSPPILAATRLRPRHSLESLTSSRSSRNTHDYFTRPFRVRCIATGDDVRGWSLYSTMIEPNGRSTINWTGEQTTPIDIDGQMTAILKVQFTWSNFRQLQTRLYSEIIFLLAMFAILVSGRLPQRNFQTVSNTQIVFPIDNATAIQHLAVFMTGDQALPPVTLLPLPVSKSNVSIILYYYYYIFLE